MRRLLRAATVALGALASAASSAAAPGTLRLDNFLAGGRGVYRFEVRDANYVARAFYRPQLDCVMFTRNVVPFCQVWQRALEHVIDLYAGPRSAD